MKYGLLLRLVDLMSLVVIFSCWIRFQGEGVGGVEGRGGGGGGGEPYFGDFMKKTKQNKAKQPLLLACVEMFVDWFLQNWCGERHYWTLQFNASLNYLELHSRSQLYEKATTYSLFLFSLNLSADVDEIEFSALTCWLVQAHAKYVLPGQNSMERTILWWFDELYL